MKLLDTTPKLYPFDEATRIADELNASVDWVYLVVHDPKYPELYTIDVFDEIGKYVWSWY